MSMVMTGDKTMENKDESNKVTVLAKKVEIAIKNIMARSKGKKDK
ncbi:hypothetical protein TpMuguga_03g02275 [Theileria parva strain Muguga]|nr:uncharacterized protein TpMuguga_03g02275 [Theileria parva strain Muguga]KAF5153095.1 hypothetical protein TpMuguga_03g02275 [Theileria parva strain Muguga]